MLVERLLKVALLGSSWVLYLLLFLSVVSLSTMFERVLYFRRHSGDFDSLRKALRKHLQDANLPAVERLLSGSKAIEARVALEAWHWASGGPGAMTDAADSELGRVKQELERGTALLGTLGNNAPFVGLLGTVLGVIISFHALGDTGQNTQAMGGVMSGISEALVATGVGLFVALPAVVGYNWIQKRIGEVESGALSLTKLLTAYVRAQDRAVSGPAFDFKEMELDHAPLSALAIDAESDAVEAETSAANGTTNPNTIRLAESAE